MKGFAKYLAIGLACSLLACVSLVFLWLGITTGKTKFAPGYSYTRFRHVRQGMSKKDVMKLLGQPLEKWRSETWNYEVAAGPGKAKQLYTHFSNGVFYYETSGDQALEKKFENMTRKQVENILQPRDRHCIEVEEEWNYSKLDDLVGNYRRRDIVFDRNGKVTKRIAEFVLD